MFRRFIFPIILLAAGSLLTSCYTHNFPLPGQRFVHVEAPVPSARVYSDANGTFFPELWLPRLGVFRNWPADSLLNEAIRFPDFDPRLRSEQARQMAELRQFLAGKRRIFVFIHGFNNNQRDTETPFAMMAHRIAFQDGDAVLMFHWDGYDDRVPGSPALFWWMAVANSQMAGTRGLRPILEAAGDDAEVFLISHSRGASVILSAISDPPYSERFIRDTMRLPFAETERLLNPPTLSAGRRNIHAILLAPAIGRVDFLAPDCPVAFDRRSAVSCDRIRQFPRLASIRYTLNACDEVLEKIIGLSNVANPTNLGLIPRVGEDIAAELQPQPIVMQPYRIIAPHDHDFSLYTADPEFSAMMRAVGVESRLWPTPPQPESCRRSRQEAELVSG